MDNTGWYCDSIAQPNTVTLFSRKGENEWLGNKYFCDKNEDGAN